MRTARLSPLVRPARLAATAMAIARRHPVTTTYLLLLVASRIVLSALSPRAGDAVELAISTNLDNLVTHPAFVLLASGLLVSGSVLVSLVGVGLCVGVVERRLGSLRALGVFLAGHIGATLLTAVVIMVGIAHGWYGPDIRQALDYGASYGMLASAGAVTAFTPRGWRPVWVVAVVLYPLKDMPGQPLGMPDFSVFGHMFSVLIGFAIAAAVLRADRTGRRAGAGVRLVSGGVVAAEARPVAVARMGWRATRVAARRLAVASVGVAWAARSGVAGVAALAADRMRPPRARRALGVAMAGAGAMALAGVALLPAIDAAPASSPAPATVGSVVPTPAPSRSGHPHVRHHHHHAPLPWPLSGYRHTTNQAHGPLPSPARGTA